MKRQRAMLPGDLYGKAKRARQRGLFTLNQGVDNTLGERIFERRNWTSYVRVIYHERGGM